MLLSHHPSLLFTYLLSHNRPPACFTTTSRVLSIPFRDFDTSHPKIVLNTMESVSPSQYNITTTPNDQKPQTIRKGPVSPTNIAAGTLIFGDNYSTNDCVAKHVADEIGLSAKDKAIVGDHPKIIASIKDRDAADQLPGSDRVKTIEFSALYDRARVEPAASILSHGSVNTARVDGPRKIQAPVSGGNKSPVLPHCHIRNDMNVDLYRSSSEFFSDPAAVKCLASSLFEVRVQNSHDLDRHGKSVLLHSPYGADMMEFVTRTATVMGIRLVSLNARELVARCEDGVHDIMSAFDEANGDESSSILVLHNAEVLLCAPKESDPLFLVKNSFMRAVSFMGRKDALLFVTSHPDMLGDDVVKLLDIGVVPFELDGALVRAEVFEEILEVN